ncbi:aryldialkylphosphatase [Nakamurella silvestris]|nr:aryldialkylphosphatase [Nakamurella silvestris]
MGSPTLAAVPAVRTVLGDVAVAGFGTVNYHEHLFQVSPLLPGDELDDERASRTEAESLRDSGFAAMVEATPTGVGRRPEAVARIAAATGLNIVATSGAHRQAHYPQGHWLTELDAGALASRFVAEVTDGLPLHDALRNQVPAHGPAGATVRAGLLKAGIDYWRISDFERRVLAAVAQAHLVTGAPIMVHLEHGSAAFEVLALLAADGVPADAVALAHIDRNPDPGLHAELAAVGAYLGYDGVARSKSWPDSVLLDCLLRTAELGGQERILLGGDVARRSRYRGYGGMPGLQYLGERFVPRLAATAPPGLLERVLIGNPAGWLGRFESVASAPI